MNMKKKVEHIRLANMDKEKLKDFNIEEARGWTINRLQQIEIRLNNLIVDHFKPLHKEVFEKVVLNSSIIDIGGKLKILQNIKAIDKPIVEKIRKIATIRNGFAHAPTHESVLISIYEPVENNTNVSSVLVESTLEVMNSQGYIKSKSAYEYLVEFWETYSELRTLLDN